MYVSCISLLALHMCFSPVRTNSVEYSTHVLHQMTAHRRRSILPCKSCPLKYSFFRLDFLLGLFSYISHALSHTCFSFTICYTCSFLALWRTRSLYASCILCFFPPAVTFSSCDCPHHFSVSLIFGFVMKLGGVPDGRMKVLPCVLSNLCHTFCKHCAIAASACLRWSISLYHFRESRTLDAASLSLSVYLWCFSLQFYRPVCKSHITKNRSEQPISIAEKGRSHPVTRKGPNHSQEAH